MSEKSIDKIIRRNIDRDEESGKRAGRVSARDWLGDRFASRALARMDEENERAARRLKAYGVIVVVVALLLAGCASTAPVPLAAVNGFDAADFETGDVPGPTAHTAGLGSLWPGQYHRNIVADHRAGFINDLVTVDIVEDSSAEGKAETKTGRSSSVGAGISGLLGFEQTLAKSRPNMNLDTMVGAKTDNSFNGTGETTRSTKVVATMSCTVVEVFPNGNMLIRGKRMIKVNGEDQIITLSGIIRPYDIDTDNTVQSTDIADARITYWGVGVLADKQKPGWMMRALDNVWPF